MTSGHLLYAVVLALLGGALAYAAGTARRESLALAAFFAVSFGSRVAAVAVNERFGIFPQKFAACFPLDMINQPGGLWRFFETFDSGDRRAVAQVKFLIEAAANVPGIALFGNSHIILNLTNCLAGSLAGLLVFAYMRRLFDRNTAIFALLLVSFFPAAFNFSFFGLRDIFLYLFILANIASLAWLVLRPDRRALQLAVYLASFVCIGLLRSAFLPFMLVLPAFLLARRFVRYLSDTRDRRRRLLIMGGAGVVALVALLSAYGIVLHHLGIKTFVGPQQLFSSFVEARASRGTPFAKAYRANSGAAIVCKSMSHPRQNAARGVASQYIPFKTYRKTPWIVREAIQLVGFIVIPLPWQLDRLSRALALFDTIFVIAVAVAAWRSFRSVRAPPPGSREDALRVLSMGLLLSAFLGWIGYGLFVTDAGNAFRLRLTVVPFVLFGASLYLAGLPWLNAWTDKLLRRWRA